VSRPDLGTLDIPARKYEGRIEGGEGHSKAVTGPVVLKGAVKESRARKR
jgi:hypothetical protein